MVNERFGGRLPDMTASLPGPIRTQPPNRVHVTAIVNRPPELRPDLGSGARGDEMRWLIEEGRRHASLAALLDAWCWRLVAIGVPVARATVNVGTLHPQLTGFAARWTAADGTAEELSLEHGLLSSEAFQRSPIRRIFETGEPVRRRLEDRTALAEFPILSELAAQGCTDYLALPLQLGGVTRNSATFASSRPGGFADEDIALITTLAPGLSIVLELLAQRRISRTLLDVYLGAKAGSRVLAGEIVRGSGEPIRAAIWTSDLRDFTRLSDRLPGARVIHILNRVFETQVEAIGRRGGEVLKFVGDGLIAIFPIDDAAFVVDRCAAALDAARAALEANVALNDELAAEPDRPQARLAVALHVGEAMFGNIGGADRLDFTVIGPAVNAVSRLERLAKTLGRDLVVSGAFAEAARDPSLVSLGLHDLRGFSEAVEVFAPGPDAARVPRVR
jgi:adenylate cyclase